MKIRFRSDPIAKPFFLKGRALGTGATRPRYLKASELKVLLGWWWPSGLTFYSDDPSSNPPGNLNFLHGKTEINEKQSGAVLVL